MLGYETRLSPQLWAIYAASTMPDWLALPASPEESGLSRDELAALRLLRDRMEGTAARSVPGRVARGESPLDGDVQHALDALNDRVTRVYERAAPMLRAWEHSLTAPLPAWTTQMQRAMNAVFSAGVGETEDYRVPLFLLPSSAEHHGRKAALYLRFPPTTLECAGEPSDELLEALHFDLMHGATHACQGPLLDPLTEEYLASPAGQHTLAAYEGALRDAAGLPTPEAHWNRIQETVPRVLRERDAAWTSSQLYDAWILGGSVRLLPEARRLVASENPIDLDFVRAAFEALDDLLAQAAGRRSEAARLSLQRG